MKHIGALFFLALLGFVAQAQQPLHIPDTLHGPVYNLQIRHDSMAFYPGAKTQTMGINGAFLAPTLILQKGQQVRMVVNNALNDTTTIHWHGLHVAPHNDGGPYVTILSGTTWSPEFTVLDWASTYWYHPHLHYKTTLHVAKGAAGFIIVRDSLEATLNLPRRYGVDDIPLVIQTRQFDANNQIVIKQHLDTAVMVNGTRNAFVQLPAQVVRLRVLNGSLERVYNLGLSTNETFHMIASDGGLLAAPVAMTRLQLAPGERAELLVNLSGKNGQSLQLMNYGSTLPNAVYGAAQPGMGPGQQLPGYSQNPRNGANYTLLQINVGTPTDLPVTTIPTTLAAHQIPTVAQADTTRIFTFMSANMGPTAIQGPFMINNAHFDMNVINERVPFDNTEIWELRNQTPIGHPFHLHNVPFYVLTVNGAAPATHLRGRKDVIFVPAMGTVRFITQFETFWNDTLPYMYHCHMLTHEDDGMMGAFVVTSPFPTSVRSLGSETRLQLYPNPTQGQLNYRIAGLNPWEEVQLRITDLQGRLVQQSSSMPAVGTLDLQGRAEGLYLVHFQSGSITLTSRILVQQH
ncbi:MAG: bilirubin oxidase [Sphingobacteriaceae bacterium]|nr:bilirubin oxidase [Sphingobacteriaceae bacterium]